MSTPGGFDFEQLKRMMEQLGLNADDLDLDELMKQMQRLQESGGIRFGITPADQDPEAAWRTTITAARHLASELGPDPSLTPGERLAIVDAERLAQSWLDPVTQFTSSGTPLVTQRREEWIEATSAGWRRLVEPIIDGLADALQRGTTGPGDSQFADFSSMLAPMMRTSASLIYRDRLSKVLASVAGSTLTGSEVGISLTEGAAVTVLPANVAEFTRDLDLPDSDVMLYLLLREAARQRLFQGISWLSPQLEALLAHYAREIRIDFEALSSQLDIGDEEVSLEEIVAVGEKVRGSFFKPASTDLQLEILGRLEVLLALIEGWVDHVTNRAASSWMTNSTQLDEVIRRRRASADPTREVFRDLLGLDLRPRLIRDAENLWAAMEHRHGALERDGVWRHPDMLPTARHLEDPLSYVHPNHRDQDDGDFDAELRKLLGE
ncbi:zinc-dependent metalloprotease [[Pseudopropionibacterium] massiliense]|uniref:zinc-dependent metalloprotease n=1 Tax=[Pseudopropionibacterium] massiliense TaxID=2220000 RepID=UPI00102FC176|nr:zinc-dependent metalloprotease [[Pseudopropionibacterium] massiliense]